MKVAIVILHYKNIKDTLRCLKSVEKLDKGGFKMEIIVVNNSLQKLHLGGVMASPSTSSGSACHPVPTYVGTSEVVIPLFVVHNKKNLGFAAGVNAGIKKALQSKDTDYILILNNDTILPANLLVQLLKEPVDIVSPVIKFKWGKEWKYDFGGKVNWQIGRTKHIESTNQPSPSRSHFVTPGRWPKGLLPGEKSIDYVSGCCMLVRREVFEKIGLFDEDYFFYFEDADFCVRAKKAGFRISVDPNTCVFHKLSASIGRWSNQAVLHNLKSNFLFIIKHLGWRIPIGLVYLSMLAVKIVVNRLRGR